MIYKDSILSILKDTWPTLLLVTVVLLSMRVIYLIKNKEKLLLYNELMYYFFIMYILCLFYVVTFQDVSWAKSNFIPFKEILRYDFGTRLFYKNVLGNAVIFMPFGFFVSYILKIKKVPLIMFLSFITSATIEATQLVIGRVFDVDDILLNTLGGILGFILYKVIHVIKDKLPQALKKDYIYNIIMMLFIVIIILVFNWVIK